MQIINGQQFMFSSTTGSAKSATQNFEFGQDSVISATAVIVGIDVEFANRNDHHLGRLQVSLDTRVNHSPIAGQNDTVSVDANFGLRDWSGGSAGDDLNGDDPVKGTIQYSIFIITAP